MVSEARKQSMAWTETDYSKHTNFRWKVKSFGRATNYGWLILLMFHNILLTYRNIFYLAEGYCFSGSGESYRGNVSVTENGYVCQRWNETTPHHHLLLPSKYPELRGGHNFCRNPGGDKKRPWCFTTDPKKMYDFCALKSCGMCECFPWGGGRIIGVHT